MFYISLWCSKLYYFLTTLFKRPITDRAGLLALKIYPKFLEKLTKPETIIVVTGTNGKTTASNFLVDLLEDNGYKVTSNREGANYKAGITKAMMKGVTIFNKSKVNVAIFEMDELSCDILFPALKPDYLVVTNIFRDSVPRNGHVEYVYDQINDYILDDTTLILNADDLLSSTIGLNNRRILFGIDKLPTDVKKNDSIVQDIRICPKCSHLLKYDYVRYHQIGKLHCENCGFTNYKADYLVTDINFDKKSLKVRHDKKVSEFPLIVDSLFNIYNELTAITVLKDMGLDNEKIKKSLSKLEIIETRYSSQKINDLELITHFAKGQNPIATSRVIDYVSNLLGNNELILVIDDQHENLPHGASEVISWIYDVDFEYLNKPNIKKIIVGGVRCYDYKIRLLLAGIDESKLFFVPDELDAYKHLDLKNTDKVIIVHDLYTIDICKDIVDNIKDVIS